MFQRILFPTDFSDYARRVMDCIAGLPGAMEVVMVHVISSDSPKTSLSGLMSSAKDRLESEQTILQSRGFLQIKTEVLFSETIAGGIQDAAARNNVSSIVMGARGKGLIKGLHLGSVTHRVLHESDRSLLIIRGPVIEKLAGDVFEQFCPMIFSRVLIAVDLSFESWEAARMIAALPDVSEIIVSYVISRGETESELEETRKGCEKILKEECDRIRTTGADIRWRILEGDPVESVHEYAREQNVSLMCTIPTDKGFFAEFLHGSFSCELARRATRPVLIIRRHK